MSARVASPTALVNAWAVSFGRAASSPTIRKDVLDNTVEDDLPSAALHRQDGGVDLVAWLDARYRLVDFLLLRTDDSAWLSGSKRVPLLDHRFVEFMARVPAKVKLKDSRE